MKQLPILIMAGGTGGHIFPALAVARHLKSLGHEVHWLGAQQGMESTLVDTSEFPLHLLPVTAMKGGGLTRKLAFPVNLLRSLWAVLKIFQVIQPAVVVGFGGYASGPGGIIAALTRRPLVLHEQNAVAGFTNRMLAQVAQQVIEAFPATFGQADNVHTLGNPVRLEVLALRESIAPVSQLNHILVLGGSLGAQSLNQWVPEAIAAMPPEQRPQVWHQAGAQKTAPVTALYAQKGVAARVDAFIDKMDEAYAWADLVVCRSGASTVSELAAIGKPSLLMPYPWHKDRQQFINADYLVQVGAAQVMPQDDTAVAVLTDTLLQLRTAPEVLQRMASAAKAQGKPEAVSLIGKVITDLLPPHMGIAA